MSDELYDIRQAAQRLGVSESRVRQFCRAGRLGEKVGARWVIRLSDLERFDQIKRRPGRARVEGGE